MNKVETKLKNRKIIQHDEASKQANKQHGVACMDMYPTIAGSAATIVIDVLKYALQCMYPYTTRIFFKNKM